MLNQIKGLHHVTSLASSAVRNNAFFTDVLGLRRVKKTVNFDAPDVYHLYYGDEVGTPGTVMTYFPFEKTARGTRGVGEVGVTSFAIPKGTSKHWIKRLTDHKVANISTDDHFGETRILFDGPDGEGLALIETNDNRAPWADGGIDTDQAIRGFRGADMVLRDTGPEAELLQFMGYDKLDTHGGVTRYALPDGSPANVIDLAKADANHARSSAGSVHHIAFAVENRARQLEVREALLDTGYQVTPVIDRDYFYAIYFRTPGGILFEVATNEPGFDKDEDTANLGQALKLPSQHEHLRMSLEKQLVPLS